MAEAHAKHHDYHLVDPSPWPVIGGVGSLTLAIGTGLATYAVVVVALERLALWNRRVVAAKRVSFESATSIPAPTVHG